MRIIHWGKARQFYKKHPAAEGPLKQWRKAVQKASWTNFSDIRGLFSSADWVKGKIIFNIKGNHYRLIAVVIFKNEKVYVKQVLTHEKYNQNRW